MKKLLLILLCLPMIGFGQIPIPDANFKAFLVANSGINTNGDSEIQVSEAASFSGLINCYGLSISDLTGIEYFVSIQGLSCSQNQLTNLNISSNSNLQILNCGDNQLTSLDISNNPNLYFLTCYNNYLSSLDLRNGYNNQFDSVWTYGNPNLTCISVDDSVYSTNNWTGIAMMDSQHFFSNNCPTFIFGCTDSLACNYDPLATIDDSSCCYSNTYLHSIASCDYYTTWNGIIYTSNAVYTDTFPATNACVCDSIVTVFLTISPSTFSYDTLSATSSVVWNGSTLNISGNYSDSLINSNSAGCDSIAYLNLTITNTTGLLDVTNTEKTLLKITDMLGQETPSRRNTPLFYIYDDGTVERKLFLD